MEQVDQLRVHTPPHDVTVTFNGQTLKQAADRPYTHAILARFDRKRALQKSLLAQERYVRRGWDYKVVLADGSDVTCDRFSAAQIMLWRKEVAGGLEAAVKKALDQVHRRYDLRAADGENDLFVAIAWCDSHSSAVKELEERQSSGVLAEYTDCVVVPVEPIV
ncbi:MAG: hypothetical protein K0M67_21470 [Thiobacillus sp.]|nr:hypothetical protein [Thiobacillus sp.]